VIILYPPWERSNPLFASQAFDEVGVAGYGFKLTTLSDPAPLKWKVTENGQIELIPRPKTHLRNDMKTAVSGVIFGTVLTAAILVSGCASTGSKASSTTRDMDQAANEVNAIVAQTDRTLTSLSNLVLHPAPNLVPQHREFTKDTQRLASLSARLDATAAQMEGRAEQYFKEWDEGTAKISNEQLRATSEERRADVSSAFDAVASSLQKSRAAFDPFLADLKDIRQVLNLDLTQGGIRSVQGVAMKAMAHGEELREELSAVAQNITRLSAKMAPQGPSESR
jgi:hypothetical protein